MNDPGQQCVLLEQTIAVSAPPDCKKVMARNIDYNVELASDAPNDRTLIHTYNASATCCINGNRRPMNIKKTRCEMSTE